MDPNQKLGPAGFGDEHFIQPGRLLGYRIDFENDPAAGAPAQYVTVSDQLDSDLDWTTLELTEVGFGDHFLAIPPGAQFYQTVEAMTYNDTDFEVHIEIDFDAETGRLEARFMSLDPETGWPPDVMTGFLPPEDGTGRGMGHVSYAIDHRPGLPTGAEIRNVAVIQFDFGEIIATNQVDPHDPAQGTDPAKEALVTIDAAAPTSSVAPLPPQAPDTAFLVEWAGQDDPGGSGISSYDIYVATDGGDYTLWLDGTAATSDTFTGQRQHTYAFYSVATDNVGHQEPAPADPDAAIEILGNQAPTIASLDDTPDPVNHNEALTLAASGVADPDGTLAAVTFYRDANGNHTLEVGTDAVLGTDNDGGDGWAWTGAATWAGGTHTYFAHAQDNDGDWSDPAQASGTVRYTHLLIAGGKAKKWTFTDADGDPVSLVLGGKAGTAQIVRGVGDDEQGDILHIVVDGTDAKSSLKISSKGETSVEDITVHGSLKQISAKTTDLLGDLTVDGWLGKAQLGDVADAHTIAIGGSVDDKPICLVFDQVQDLALDSDTPIKALTVTEWLDTDATSDQITTPWLGKLTVKGAKANAKKGIAGSAGDFQADLTLGGADAKGKSLGSAKVAGTVSDASWTLAGDAGAINAGLAADWQVEAGGGIASVTALQWLDTDGTQDELGAAWLGKLTMKGRKANAKKGITALAGDFQADLDLDGADKKGNSLGSATIAGGVGDAEWDVANSAGKVTVKGTVDGWQANLKGGLKSLTSGDIDNANVSVSDALGTVKAQRWGSGTLDANTIKAINITGLKANAKKGIAAVEGTFGADLSVRGENVTKGSALGSARIAADLTSGSWAIDGDMGKLTVGRWVLGTDVLTSGDMLGLTLGGADHGRFFAGVDLDTKVFDQAGQIRAVTVKGWKVSRTDPPLGDLGIGSEFWAASMGSVTLRNESQTSPSQLHILGEANAWQIKSVKHYDTRTRDGWYWRPGLAWPGPAGTQPLPLT